MQSNKVPLPGLANPEKMANNQIPEGRNPFAAVATWTPEMLSKIEILISEPIETTSDFTRQKKKGARYWSSDVTFKYKEYESKVIKMGSCDVPFIQGESYGTDFVYALINRAIGDAIVKAGNEATLSVQANDDKLACSGETWWKTINKTKGRIGTLDKSGNFNARDLHTIMVKTESGMRGTVDAIFKLKAHTNDGSNRTGRTVFKITADCSRCYIKQINQEIDAPPLEAVVDTIKGAKADIATDELMNQLDQFEI